MMCPACCTEYCTSGEVHKEEKADHNPNSPRIARTITYLNDSVLEGAKLTPKQTTFRNTVSKHNALGVSPTRVPPFDCSFLSTDTLLTTMRKVFCYIWSVVL